MSYFWHLIWPQTRWFVSDDEWKIMDILISIKAWAGRMERGNCQKKWKELGDLELSINHYVDDLWLKKEGEEKGALGAESVQPEKRNRQTETMMMHAENRNSRKEERKEERNCIIWPWLNWINNWLRVKSGMTHPFSQRIECCAPSPYSLGCFWPIVVFARFFEK